jgi:gluconolactonase
VTRFTAIAVVPVLSAALLQGAPQQNEMLEVHAVSTNLRYPDGLAWSRAGGYLVIADSAKKELYRLDPGAAPKPTHQNTNGVQGVAYDSQDRLYFCEALSRRLTRLDRNNKLEVLVDKFDGKKLNSPNDVVVRKDGQIYFTDPAFAGAVETRELDFNGIFHVTPKGEVDVVARWKTRPNGIALSPDGKILYVSDSDRRAVVAFDLDKSGSPSNPRDAITKIEGIPGGIRTDVAGNLYVAAMGVGVYTPQGKKTRTLLIGEPSANLAFGGEDLETLYISSRKSVFMVHLDVKGALQ